MGYFPSLQSEELLTVPCSWLPGGIYIYIYMIVYIYIYIYIYIYTYALDTVGVQQFMFSILFQTPGSRFIKGGAVETGCSDLYAVIY